MILDESLKTDYQYIIETHKIKEIIRSPLKMSVKKQNLFASQSFKRI